MMNVIINASLFTVAVTGLALAGCVFMPLLMRLSGRLDGFGAVLATGGTRV